MSLGEHPPIDLGQFPTTRVRGKVGPVVPARCSCGTFLQVTVTGETPLQDYEVIAEAWKQLHREQGHEPLWPDAEPS